MNKILHIIGEKYNILITKGVFVYRVILEDKKSNILYTLKCIRSRGKLDGVFVYYVINSLKINAIIDFSYEKELIIDYTNGPKITLKY